MEISFWTHNWGPGMLRDNMLELYSFSLDKSLTLHEARQHMQITSVFRLDLSIEAQEQLQELVRHLGDMAPLQETMHDEVI